MRKYKLSNLRLSMFWLLDSFSGGLAYKHYLDLKKCSEKNFDISNYQKKQLDKLNKHVTSTVPFYINKEYNSLQEFPIVNKIMMKNDINSFLSNSNIKIGKIRHTSGSTGIPFKILQDINKSKRVNAETIYFRELAGDQLGKKYINVMAPSKLDSYSKLAKYKLNLMVFDVTKMDDDNLEKLNHYLLNNNDVHYLLSYASGLDAIANYFEKKGYENNSYPLKAIVSSSEILTKITKEKLEKIFKCKVFNRYSNEDNGFIAQTDGISDDFIINEASFIIEILKLDSDETAKENEVGRIVITDLYNFAQPFIRYDTGDLGTISSKEINGKKVKVLTSLQGRKSDLVYDSNDTPISTFALGGMMEEFPLINQYQIIQNDKNSFELIVNDSKASYRDEEYTKAFRNLLGNEINLKVKIVEDIPKLSSGKFKRIICNYEPKKK